MSPSPDSSQFPDEHGHARHRRTRAMRSLEVVHLYAYGNMYSPGDYNFAERRHPRRRRGCACLPLSLFLLLIVGLLGVAAWTGLLPVRSFVHTGPISIAVSDSPTLFIDNEAYNSSELLQREAAPLHIHAGTAKDTILITAPNIPLIGDPLIAYRQSSDRAITFLTVDYHYRGTIDIAVPAHTNIKLNSHDDGATISGLTGRMVINTYKGNISVTNCTFSGPSLIKSYQGAITLQNVILKYASSFFTYQGDITFQGTLAPEGHHFFNTYKGKITLTLPSTSAFIADASDYQGEIVTDFPGLKPADRELHGTVGQSPRAYLHLYTYSNTILLQRAKGV